MPLNNNGNAPLPEAAFNVGIVGHRPDRLEDAGKIAEQIGRLLSAIESAISDLSSGSVAGAGHRIRLVSALAEGADRIAARVALGQGKALVAVLPFPAEVYQGDFADEASRADFAALLQAATSTIVLDGTTQARERAYDRAGLLLLDNVDLLIAVWDGGPGRGRGGTREVIEEAARRSVPLVTISPDGLSVELCSSGPDAPAMRLADVPRRPVADVPALVASLLAPPDDKARVRDWHWLQQTPRFGIAQGAYPLLLRLSGGSARRRTAVQAPSSPPHDGLAEAFAWWDRAAVAAAQAFRSAVIVNFALAALAVVLSAASLLAGHAKWVLVALEVATILLLLVHTTMARRQAWQDRWLESREVAEMLRVAILRRMVGIGRTGGGTGLTGRYVAAWARAADPLTLDLSDPQKAGMAAIEQVREQAEWNTATAHRMHRAAHRIERFGEVLFATVLIAAIGWLAVYFIRPELGTMLKYPLTAITAGLPAIATSSYGIRVIIDFEGIAERARRVADRLFALLAQLEEDAEAGGPGADQLQHFARAASAAMVADVAAWRLLAEGRRLTIPG
ncbi:hypothetical protein [Novosphingobium jiangmenense]|uniref:SMODS and SLOG-associating 2TM effector domain-containing protein n=1 Tax=Novosphingobium jiangmenense TaxID=2791981 RepID=A0ABS0HJ17_9SPHN|nr:hypothetical protein [Novosphingobium jiangmenense]MBF9152231.1 hypothetical protein [Novosphingobium jiangmenense]